VPDLGVRETAGDRAKHVEFALRELLDLSWRRGMRNTGVDHALRDRRREKCLSAGNGADCRQKLFGRVVLEDEPAGAGAAVVAHLELHLVGPVAHRHIGLGGLRVLERIA
jgi:hypothetical protein